MKRKRGEEHRILLLTSIRTLLKYKCTRRTQARQLVSQHEHTTPTHTYLLYIYATYVKCKEREGKERSI
jgi:hypothetical protein